MSDHELTQQADREKKDPYSFLKTIRVLYIISAVFASPVVGGGLDLIGLWTTYLEIFLLLRIFYVLYIPFVILTVLYILVLKSEKPPKGEYILFTVLCILHLIGFAHCEIIYKAAMGI